MHAIIVVSALQPDALWHADALFTDWQTTKDLCAFVCLCVTTPRGFKVTDWVNFD